MNISKKFAKKILESFDTEVVKMLSKYQAEKLSH